MSDLRAALPEPAATIARLTEKLREDLAFAAPELWPLHIERRLAEAYEAALASARGDLTDLAAEIAKDWNGRSADLVAQIEKAVRGMHDWRPIEGGTLGAGAQRCAFKGCDDTPERHVTWANVLAAILAAAPVEATPMTDREAEVARSLRDALQEWLDSHPDDTGPEERLADVAKAWLALRAEPVEVAPDHEHYWIDAPDDETGWFCTICRATEHPGEGVHEDAALAATEPPSPEPLDVERLARALQAHVSAHKTRSRTHATVVCCKAIATEYARLSEGREP